ncbi:hypothetical protein D3P08_27060 [Paenibacillus nanensis]|uniref:PepSY domain-containing protein n=1 Tax=Paenibacillus nanensis TaxID=393251 RepID=A0A3A1UHM4_9BACL|nr:hypothetical protein [Paenibacillus nanensis]RIX45335.1 hypothetical protein D3P08_27060 [Paenibacillus nanensis]
MKKLMGILLTIVLIIAASLIYDYFTVSKKEARQIAERYVASESFKWKVGSISRDRGTWVVYLSSVDAVNEITWLIINNRSGSVNKITQPMK